MRNGECCTIDGWVETQEVTLTVRFYPPVITTQPRSVTVDNGEEAVFTVGAVGENLTYMWYGRSPADEEWGMLYDGQSWMERRRRR